jgi:hypothetical protein
MPTSVSTRAKAGFTPAFLFGAKAGSTPAFLFGAKAGSTPAIV